LLGRGPCRRSAGRPNPCADPTASTRSRDLSFIDLITAPYAGFNWLLDFVFATAYGMFVRFGAPIVFFAALTESTLGLGMVFPGQQIISLGGAASAKGQAGNVYVMLAFATAGTILGDVISYTVGRRFSTTLYQSRFGPGLRVAAGMMEGRARWLIPFYHFYSVTRSVGPAAAGALRIPVRIWLPLDIFGASLFNTVWIFAGFAFGTALLQEDGTLKESPVIRIGLVVVAMAWFIVARQLFERRLRQVRRAEEEAAAVVPVDGVPDGPDTEPALREQGRHDSTGLR